MGVAFEMARVALGLAEDRDDLANEMIAKRSADRAGANMMQWRRQRSA
jgi:hypothetical protein